MWDRQVSPKMLRAAFLTCAAGCLQALRASNFGEPRRQLGLVSLNHLLQSIHTSVHARFLTCPASPAT